jgi:hypothetical protein
VPGQASRERGQCRVLSRPPSGGSDPLARSVLDAYAHHSAPVPDFPPGDRICGRKGKAMGWECRLTIGMGTPLIEHEDGHASGGRGTIRPYGDLRPSQGHETHHFPSSDIPDGRAPDHSARALPEMPRFPPAPRWLVESLSEPGDRTFDLVDSPTHAQMKSGSTRTRPSVDLPPGSPAAHGETHSRGDLAGECGSPVVGGGRGCNLGRGYGAAARRGRSTPLGHVTQRGASPSLALVTGASSTLFDITAGEGRSAAANGWA